MVSKRKQRPPRSPEIDEELENEEQEEVNSPSQKKQYTHFTDAEDKQIIDTWDFHHGKPEIIHKYVLKNRAIGSISQHITRTASFLDKLHNAGN